MMSSMLGVRLSSSRPCAHSIATVVAIAIGRIRYLRRRISMSSTPSGTNSRMFAENSMRAYVSAGTTRVTRRRSPPAPESTGTGHSAISVRMIA